MDFVVDDLSIVESQMLKFLIIIELLFLPSDMLIII